jgi:hypothetical protein
LISDRRSAFLSIVRLIVSVSVVVVVVVLLIGVGLVLLELAEPPEVMACEAVSKFPDRFDSSKALSASWVSADGDDLAGNN